MALADKGAFSRRIGRMYDYWREQMTEVDGVSVVVTNDDDVIYSKGMVGWLGLRWFVIIFASVWFKLVCDGMVRFRFCLTLPSLTHTTSRFGPHDLAVRLRTPRYHSLFHSEGHLCDRHQEEIRLPPATSVRYSPPHYS